VASLSNFFLYQDVRGGLVVTANIISAVSKFSLIYPAVLSYTWAFLS